MAIRGHVLVTIWDDTRPAVTKICVANRTPLAVPALIAYNNFNGKVRVARSEMRDFALEFMNLAERHFT